MTSRLSEVVTESERDRLDLQMLFGVHVYSRAKVVPGPGAVPRRGCASRGEAPGRPGDRVPGRRRRGADACSSLATSPGRSDGSARPRPRRRSRPDADAGPSSSRRGAAWPEPAAGDAEGMREHLETRRGDRDRGRAGVGALRGPGPPRRSRGRAVPSRPASPPDPALAELVERSADAGEGAAAAPARARPVGRPGRRGAGGGRTRARRHRGGGGGGRRGLRGPPGRAPRGRQPRDRASRRPGRCSPAARPRSRTSCAATSRRRCRGSPRGRRTRRSASPG